MKEKLITLESAKVAKDKGFDYPCTSEYWERNDKEMFLMDGQELCDLKFQKENTDHVDDMTFICGVPSQSLLQKWLRDKHEISVLVHLDVTLSYVYEIRPLSPSSTYQGNIIVPSNVWMNYEECLEEGLKESLKLIKIK